MDLSFGRARVKPAASLPLDYPRLVAILTSLQGASRTAQVAGRLLREDGAGRPSEGLVALFDPQCDWMAAATSLEGSFNPRLVRQKT
jgi:hypothetical protein